MKLETLTNLALTFTIIQQFSIYSQEETLDIL